jgi:homocitrate synthase NifV
LGERAGNAALEEVVMALKRIYGIDIGIETRKFLELDEAP